MATNVILPALGMAQETGKVVRWLKAEGEQVMKGDPLAEIETDKATVELEAPATGVLANVTAAGDEDIPVGQVIAMIVAPGESPQPQGRGLRNVGAGLAPAREGAMVQASTDGHEAPRTGAHISRTRKRTLRTCSMNWHSTASLACQPLRLRRDGWQANRAKISQPLGEVGQQELSWPRMFWRQGDRKGRPYM